MNPEKSEKMFFIFYTFFFKHTFYVSVLNICTVLKKIVTVTNNALKICFYSTRNTDKKENKILLIYG